MGDWIIGEKQRDEEDGEEKHRRVGRFRRVRPGARRGADSPVSTSQPLGRPPLIREGGPDRSCRAC